VKELEGQGAVNTFYAAEKENMREEELELIRKRFPSTKGLK
jgi:hypothetical protein